MNEAAASIPVGSEGISVIPFGNGAESSETSRFEVTVTPSGRLFLKGRLAAIALLADGAERERAWRLPVVEI